MKLDPKKSIQQGRMQFESNFLFGVDEFGKTVRFTKAERQLLIEFTRNPKTVRSRDRLLDAISGPGSDASDRNVDFIINRLRRKLKDSPRNPSYIATQYGEGYVWIADQAPARVDVAKAFLVIGPVRGLGHAGDLAGRARAHVEALRAALDRETAKDGKVVVDEACPPPSQFSGEAPHFAVGLDFLAYDGELHCAVTIKVFRTGHILSVARYRMDPDPNASGLFGSSIVKVIAADVTGSIWDALAYPPPGLEVPTEIPLGLRMHEAGNVLGGELNGWEEADRQLREVRWGMAEERLRAAWTQDPNDARAQLMLATCLHAKYVTGTSGMILPENDFRARDEDEMERLVLAALPRLQNNPVFMTAAGKLLYFLGRGHRSLALEIVEKAFRRTTAFATSFAALGQIRMFRGEFDSALRLLNQGLELCESQSEAEIFFLVLKCQALLAADYRRDLDATLQLMYKSKPQTRIMLPLLFTATDTGKVDQAAIDMAQSLSERQARGVLVFSHYICARLFDDPNHRVNVMWPPSTLLARRFGPDVVPNEVRRSVPMLPRNAN